jgi:hypothetical protein
MRKLTSISLAVLILMNTMGYYLVFMGLKYQHDRKISSKVQSDRYDLSEVVTIKFPLAIPYSSNTEFQSIEGEIEYEGGFYRLIKQRFVNDTLQLVAIPDNGSKKIAQALTDYVKTFTTHSSTTNDSKSVPAFIKDYIASTFSIASYGQGWVVNIDHQFIAQRWASVPESISAPPPKA